MPFLWGEGTYSADYRITDDAFFAYVECDTCHCTSAYADTAAKAVNAWNNRQPTIDWRPIEKIDNFDLNNFGDYIFYDKFENYLIGRTDIDGYIEIGRITHDKNYLKGICTYFAIITPPRG